MEEKKVRKEENRLRGLSREEQRKLIQRDIERSLDNYVKNHKEAILAALKK